MIRQGRVVAIGAAPPCETWAIARWANGGWHQRDNPVPLRAEGCLWGRTDLTPREQRQIRTANVLLIYAIAFATLATFYGIHMWLEHPDLIQRHFEVGAVSIWLLEQLEHLVAIPVASTHRVRHCHFGGKAVKPTRLVAIRLLALARQLVQWKYPVTPSCTLIDKKNQMARGGHPRPRNIPDA